MNKINKILQIIIFVGILLLGIGYASIQNITLNVTGEITANSPNWKINIGETVIYVGDNNESNKNLMEVIYTSVLNPDTLETTSSWSNNGVYELSTTITDNANIVYELKNVNISDTIQLSISDNKLYFNGSVEEDTSGNCVLTITYDKDGVKETIDTTILIDIGFDGDGNGIKDSEETEEPENSEGTEEPIEENESLIETESIVETEDTVKVENTVETENTIRIENIIEAEDTVRIENVV